MTAVKNEAPNGGEVVVVVKDQEVNDEINQAEDGTGEKQFYFVSVEEIHQIG